MDNTASEPDDTPIPPSPVAERSSTVLDWGFRVSATLIVIGLIRALIDRQPLDSHLAAPDELLDGVTSATSSSFLALGIIAMVLTPLVSSFMIAITFFQQHDVRYGRLTVLVLLILGLSISLSLR
jgi:uncharacterized membrane protein